MIKRLFVQKASIIHELDFWTKFLCLLLLFPLSAFIAPVKVLPLLVIIFFALLAFSKIGIGKFWQNTRLYHIPIAIGVILLSLVFSPGVIQERLFYGIILVVRFVLLISLGVLFSMVTNPIEIPGGFLRARLPHKFGITLMVGYRMMPLISDKISTIIDAQRARGAEIKLSLKTLPKLPPILASLLVPILHSTLETSVRLSDTLISRGYNPDGRITVPPGRLGYQDFLILITSVIILLLAISL
jgi:energy-coupling factor transport system permease protein